jgi:hypothetical protein
MKNLIFCSATFHIQTGDNMLRENEYLCCINQLLRVIPSNFEIIICDNSVSNIDNLSNLELKNVLKKLNICFLNRNIGVNNIGMGELDELIYVSEKYDFLKYDKIVYFTLRKIVTNPWIFEQVNKMTKNALISNPPFLHLKSNYMIHYSPPTPNLYNDMFFALDKNLMMNYVQYSKSRIQYNLDNVIGSEQNLFYFIRDNHIDFDTLSYFGLIRIDYKSNNEIQLI